MHVHVHVQWERCASIVFRGIGAIVQTREEQRHQQDMPLHRASCGCEEIPHSMCILVRFISCVRQCMFHLDHVAITWHHLVAVSFIPVCVRRQRTEAVAEP